MFLYVYTYIDSTYRAVWYIYIYALLHVTHAKAISGVLHNIEPESSMCKVL